MNKTAKHNTRNGDKPFTLILKLKGYGSRTFKFFSRDPNPDRVFDKLKEKIEEGLEEV